MNVVILFVCLPSSHALTSDLSIEETARAAEFFLSDGLVITGTATGVEADPCELRGTATKTPHFKNVNVKLSPSIGEAPPSYIQCNSFLSQGPVCPAEGTITCSDY